MTTIPTPTPLPTGEPCKLVDVKCWSTEGVADVISQASNDNLQQFVNNILEGFGKAVASLGTMWVDLPSPVTVTDAGGGTTGTTRPPAGVFFEIILGWVTWASAGIAIMSLIAAGVMMASRRRHGDGEAHLGRVGVILLSVILLSSASALVAGFLPLATRDNGASSVVGWVQNQLYWYTAGLAVLSIILGAARMAWTQRAQPLKELLGSMLTLIAVAGAGLGGIVLATQAGDAFSVWILENSTDCSLSGGTITNAESNCFGTNVFVMIQLVGNTGIGLIALFILGLLALMMTWIQIMLMVFRGAMLVILAGILPATAAFTNTEMGRMWFKKALGWTIAFILYKPAAAIVYAIAFRLTGADLFKSDGSGLFQILTGLALMLIALIALPALMKFVVPAIFAVGGGGGGGGLLLAAAGAGAATEIATGAVRSSNTGGSSGGGGGDEPSGSSSTNGGGGGFSGLSPASSPTGSGATSGPGGGAAATEAAGGAAAGGGVAAGGGAAAGGAVAGGAAAAAGPVGIGVAVAGKVAEGAAAATSAVKAAAHDATGSTENGS